MRIHTLLASAISLAVSANLASASGYQFELNAGLEKATIESPVRDDRDIDAADISGTYYFNGVNTGNHPLAEAAFLERASSITLAYSNSRRRSNDGFYLDGVFQDDTSTKIESSFTSASVDFYIPNSIFFLGGGWGEGKSTIRQRASLADGTEVSFSSEDSDNFWTLRAGITPADGLLIWSEFFKDQELSDEWNLNAKYVVNLGNNALNFEAAYDSNLEDDVVYLATDYYFDRSLSLGVIYEGSENFDDNFGLRARKFFTDKLALEASYVASENYDSLRAGLTLRF